LFNANLKATMFLLNFMFIKIAKFLKSVLKALLIKALAIVANVIIAFFYKD